MQGTIKINTYRTSDYNSAKLEFYTEPVERAILAKWWTQKIADNTVNDIAPDSVTFREFDTENTLEVKKINSVYYAAPFVRFNFSNRHEFYMDYDYYEIHDLIDYLQQIQPEEPKD